MTKGIKIRLAVLAALWVLLGATKCKAEHIVSKEAHIDIKTNTALHVIGPIFPDMRGPLAAEMEIAAASKDKDLVIIINSPGGSVEFGQQIIDAVEQIRANTHKRVVCMVNGDASSMGFNLLTHCDVRLSTAHSRMVVHKIEWAGACEIQQRHTAKFYRAIAEYLDQVDEPYRQANAKAMHLDLWDYDHFADQETDWTPGLLKTIGYLHGIATIEK